MKRVKLAVAVVLLAGASAARAGSELSARLVEASKEGTSSAGLEDVMEVLKTNLPFTAYRLLGSGAAPLPAAGRTLRLAGYSVKCSGPQDNLDLEVARRKRVLLRTTISLRDGRPLIVGGFPAGRGKHVLVFVAR
jgi:hypothetical protein